MRFDNIAAMTDLCIIAFVTGVWSVAAQFWALPEKHFKHRENSGPKSFHFLCKPHVMFCIMWIKDLYAFMSVHLRYDQRFQDPPPPFLPFLFSAYAPAVSSPYILFCRSLSVVFLPLLCYPSSFSPFCQCSAAPVHSLGSTGSETVTQSSLVIGHGHANQTGRNL